MEYKFSGKVTSDEFVQMNIKKIKEVLFSFRMKIILIIFIIFFIGFIIFNTILYNRIRFFEDVLPLFIFGILIFFFNKYFIRRLENTFKKMFEKDKVSQEEQTFIINENEIKISSDSSSIKIKKDIINNIKLDEDTIYIYISENKVYLIKSRYFKELTEFIRLKEFINLNYM